MPLPKVIGTLVGLTTSIGGIGSGIAYSLGAFHPSIQVDRFIEKEGKYKLLTSKSNTAEWKVTWQEYQKGSKPWGVFAFDGEEVPQTFKNKCEEKAKELIYNNKDQAYINITLYCSRHKTINDVLTDQGFGLLNTSNETTEWQKRFDEYKNPQNQLRLPNVEIANKDAGEKDHSKLSTGCKNAINTKVIEKGYESTIAAVKHWCKSK